MSPADLATLSLLDPDQGVCPEAHPCRWADRVGQRRCAAGEYNGLGLICWDVTSAAIDVAAHEGADAIVIAWARSFVSDRDT